MKKLLFGLVLVFLGTTAWAQVSPYPDTSTTGSVPVMIGKLSQAQAAFDQAEREISDNQKKFDGLKPIQEALEKKSQKFEERSRFLITDWKEQARAFNAACSSHPMDLNSAEYTKCQRRQAEMRET